MNFKSPFIISEAFELIKVLQFECKIDEDHFWVRIEVFCELNADKVTRKYMFQIFRSEFINAVPTFYNEEAQLFTFRINHDWSPFIGIEQGECIFSASNLNEAIEKIWSHIQNYFEGCLPVESGP